MTSNQSSCVSQVCGELKAGHGVQMLEMNIEVCIEKHVSGSVVIQKLLLICNEAGIHGLHTVKTQAG